ncbi:MAG: glycoside hydrolase family 97 protein [Hyphomonadaceae bacterium]|nr:glycoside hydrolase family 97 protein [Hyphomonadaceae bacterium]MBC6411742.1 glycoside hydrolase family 97 protein [Hyphomonadaceae bacterium]
MRCILSVCLALCLVSVCTNVNSQARDDRPDTGAPGSLAESLERVSVDSPNGKNSVEVFVENGRLYYSISRAGVPVISQSRLGLRFLGRHGLDSHMGITGYSRTSHRSEWETVWGERRTVSDHHNQLHVTIYSRSAKAAFSLRFRAFDDGVGFRYEIPAQDGSPDVAIMDELTEFNVGVKTESWWIPSRMFNRYEYLYNNTPADAIHQAHTPATFRNGDGVHFSIHEAALINYSGMSLKQTRPGVLEAELAPRSDGTRVRLSGELKTPWRTIHIADKAVGLVNSDLVLNLNEPNKLGDVSWFEPGKYAGIWWDMHVLNRTWGQVQGNVTTAHGATTDYAKKYIDFAAENGFVGVLVEGWNTGWDNDWFSNGDVFSFTESYDDFDLVELARYARERGTRLIGHHETSGSITNYENQLEDALDLYEQNGVRLVKTGYVADDGNIKRIDHDGIARYEYHDGQHQIDHHMKVVRRAAEHGIAINPHEPVKATGLRRTYPNWVSREGARGQEFNAWGVPPNGPDHVPNLVFTRMLSGPMDYTAGAFNLRPSEQPEAVAGLGRHDTRSRIEHTLAKELALYVVIYSPIQMVIDSPEEYAGRPDAFQFIRDVPTDWEHSLALQGEVGEFVVIARKDRNSADWYAGAVTDEQARAIKLDLSFLDEGQYEAQIYCDGAQADYETAPYDILIKRQNVTRADTLNYNLGRSGGFAIRFKKL